MESWSPSLPLGAQKGAGPRTSRRPPHSDVVGLQPLPGEVCQPRGRGQSGGGQGAGDAPHLLAPLRRRSQLREELAQVCAGERLAGGTQGWSPGPPLSREAVARLLARPRSSASPLCPPLGLSVRRKGAAWAVPAGEYGAPTDCPCTRPQPAASSRRTASTVILGPAGTPKELSPPRPRSHVRTP